MSDPEPPATASSSTNPHLSFPPQEQEAQAPSKPLAPVPVPKQLLPDRLYVGNLHPSVDECVPRPLVSTTRIRPLHRFALVQVFSKFGKISHLDFLFHKTGALKGKPRGYAFVQYANKDVRSLPPFSRLPRADPGYLHSHYYVLHVYTHVEQATRGRDLPPEIQAG